MSKITVLYCPVEGDVKVVEKEDSLQATYELINCETIDMKFIANDICIVIDDEGRFTDKKINPHFYEIMKSKFGLGIVGDFLVTRIDYEGADISLSSKDIETLLKICELEKTPIFRERVMQMIADEELEILNNPSILAPKIYPLDNISDLFK